MAQAISEVIAFPYDSVYFKAISDPWFQRHAPRLFPYDSVYFKAMYSPSLFMPLTTDFHTIPSILKPSQYPGTRPSMMIFPYDSVYFKAHYA